ncbi:MAG: FAD-dependent oxidoreductase [Planctomycetota bacterium]|jgi:nitrite reductase (NADH) large subunit
MSEENSSAWVCSVCGYVHRGAAVPDVCPVCGSPGEDFEAYVSEPKAAVAVPVKQWRCLNCGYVHSGSEPPQECPVCGAPADCFEPLTESVEAEVKVAKVSKVVVVGGGVAGVAAVESVRSSSPETQVTLVCKEAHLPYYRLNLTRYLAGQINESELPIKPAQWYDQHDVEVMVETEVARINTQENTAELHGGQSIGFDKVILAIGAHPFMPPFLGAYREGVTSLRSLEDADQILESNLKGSRCVCIGGGLLGLETAGALAQRGAAVTLLEGHGWLLPRQLNQQAAQILEQHVTASGIGLRKKARTREIVGDERARGVLLEDETVLPADLVVVATGIRSNSYLARLAGLEVNQGIVVNNLLMSSNPDVFAAGDVAEHRGSVYGTWGPSQYQGSIAGMNAVGAKTEFGGIARSNALKVLELELFSVGQIQPEDASFEAFDQEIDDGYLRFVFRDTHLVGAVLLGDAKLANPVKKAIENKMDFSNLLRKRPSCSDICNFLAEA